jgi:hypothetical protein
MPYIPRDGRPQIDRAVNALRAVLPLGTLAPSQLAYLFARLLGAWMGSMKRKPEGLRFQDLAGLTGAVRSVWLEFEQRIIRPYESGKRSVNGDIQGWLGGGGETD